MQAKTTQQKPQSLQKIALCIPFALIVTVIVACIGAGAIALFYAFVCTVAFKSAMISLLLFGGSFVLVGIGLLMIDVFKKYRKFYQKKMGATQDEKPPVNQPSKKTFKDYLTYENVCYAILLVGTILCIISAALGAIERDKWLSETEQYFNQVGFYNQSKTLNLSYNVEGLSSSEDSIQEIILDLDNKVAVVKYDDNAGDLITIYGYTSYEGQINVLTLDNHRQIKICEGEAPSYEGALEKLMFFLWTDSATERQIVITIPSEYQGAITINGKYILALE